MPITNTTNIHPHYPISRPPICGVAKEIKPLTPKQAAAAEAKAKKAYAKATEQHKKNNLVRHRYCLFCEVYPRVRIAAGERDRAAKMGMQVIGLLPKIPNKSIRAGLIAAVRSLQLDRVACVREAWEIVEEMLEQEPPEKV